MSGFVEGGAARDKTSGLTRDDRIHGSLLVINELIMNSSFPDEVYCKLCGVQQAPLESIFSHPEC